LCHIREEGDRELFLRLRLIFKEKVSLRVNVVDKNIILLIRDILISVDRLSFREALGIPRTKGRVTSQK
jgi:hypothetical protein